MTESLIACSTCVGLSLALLRHTRQTTTLLLQCYIITIAVLLMCVVLQLQQGRSWVTALTALAYKLHVVTLN